VANFLPLADHIAGVEYDEDVDDNDDTDEDFEQDDDSYYDPDQDFDESDNDWFDTVDQDEVDDIFADNQNEHVEDELPDLIERGDEESDVSDEDEESEATYVRRSSRDIERPKRYQAAQVNKGNGKQVRFQDQDAHELEQVHNRIFHSTDEAKVKEYDTNKAIVMARMMSEINLCATSEGSNFAQQYMLKNGL